MVSLIERGHLDRASVRLVRRLFGAADASLSLDVRWRGAALDRLIDERHAALVGRVATFLRALGWTVEIEVSYSEYGERGSYDLLAIHPRTRSLLVIEVKSDLSSAEATLRKLDEKARLAGKVAQERFGSPVASVSRLLVMPATATLRRRVDRHAALFDQALPARTVAVKRWLKRPTNSIAGCWFVSSSDYRFGIATAMPAERVRLPRFSQGRHGIAG